MVASSSSDTDKDSEYDLSNPEAGMEYPFDRDSESAYSSEERCLNVSNTTETERKASRSNVRVKL